jgi:nitrogen fixation protein FixH
MKLNWGTGIVVAFASFIAFILYFVIVASTSQRANHDLVTDNYYEAELDYQNDIDAMGNARAEAVHVAISENAAGVAIRFPESWDNTLEGTAQFYRPSNKKLDFELPIALVDSEMLVPARRLPEGRWNVALRWNYKGKTYLVKESFTYTRRAPKKD